MNVKIYSTPTCGYCNMAKEFFKETKVEFEEYNVAVDAEKINEMVEKTGQMGVPVIDVDGELMIGFDKATLSNLLNIQ